MAKEKKQKLALIDAHALIHRAYHALPPMTTKKGVPVNAVYGFTTMLLKMFTTVKPTHVVACFDVKGRTFRKELFEDYKAHRKPIDDDLIAQFPIVREVLTAFNIPIIDKKGFEADDIIGTLVTVLDGEVEKIIVTGDMDTLQLVNEHTSVFTLRRGVTDTILYTPELVKETYGFDPVHIIDYKGLRGDPSDNIPGVEGIGDKTARDLVTTYGSIEDIYVHLEELPKRAKTRLEGKEKDAHFSRMLATIKRDVEVNFDMKDAKLDEYDVEKVREIFTELEFRSLLARLPGAATVTQPSLFKDGKQTELPANYILVVSDAEKTSLKKDLLQASVVAFDTENDALGARTYPIVGMSFAARLNGEIKAWYVPVTPTTVIEWKDVLENSDIKKVGHNIKYDYEVLAMSDITLQGIVSDSMIASYLLHPGSRQYGMDALAQELLGYHCIPITDLIGKGKDVKKMSEVPIMDIARYAAEDAEVTLRLHEAIQPKIEAEGLMRVLNDIEIPLIPVLAAIELKGVAVDVQVLKDLNKIVTKRLEELRKTIWKEAGSEFNINSTQQLRVILFETLKLPTVDIKKTQTGFSTAASELDKLREYHPIIKMMEEYRELNKLKNTYIETLPDSIDKKTGRIYASFNQTVAATGRLASSDPNLQNIPIRTELGQKIRRAFTASKGKVLVKADYSQLELRIAAHMSQDPKLIEAFRAGQDIHAATAAWVFGIPLDEVTESQRRQAKTLNFGVLYGMGAQAFARQAGVSVEEARSFIGRYREQYVGITKMIESTVEEARLKGFVTTMFGRKRYLPEINARAPVVRAQAERIAFNLPIQGTEADIIKLAMIKLQKHLEKNFPEAGMVLTVHDELVTEVAEKDADKVAADMKEIMQSVMTLDVPLVVDVATGKNWQDAE